jgi:hypothetical protein
MKKIMINSLAIFALAATGALALNSVLSIPDVMFSYSTDKCVKVINYVESDKYSCENLPTKFNHIWAE